MQLKNWDDLRYLIAVRRAGSLAAAARLLGVDATTVSRRLSALRSTTGAALVQREEAGKLRLTEIGNLLARRAEAMERQVDLIAEDLGATVAEVAGAVRLTSVPLIVNRLLAPALGGLLDRHPALQVELVPDSRDLSLTRREADIAIRLARPNLGGLQVKVMQIGVLPYAVYAPRDRNNRDAGSLPWITYEDAMAHLPQAKWIARYCKASRERASGLRVKDAETAMHAILAWPAKTLLPSVVGDRDPRLRRLDSYATGQLPRRDVWLLLHEDRAELRSVATVLEWIKTEISFAP